jgi:hypothetical protein
MGLPERVLMRKIQKAEKKKLALKEKKTKQGTTFCLVLLYAILEQTYKLHLLITFFTDTSAKEPVRDDIMEDRVENDDEPEDPVENDDETEDQVKDKSEGLYCTR